MREIKFRAKVLGKNTWTYSEGFIKHKDGTITVIVSTEEDHCTTSPIQEGTLCQFTGLKDKNGVEIYECDIIQDIIVGMKSEIIFTDYANFGIKSLSGVKDLEYDLIDPAWTETSAIVIGNIHDNPELLKNE